MVRAKHRYLLAEIVLPSNKTLAGFAAFDLFKLIRTHVQKVFGLLVCSQVLGALMIKYLNTDTSKTIIRCPRANYRMVWAALTFITHIGSVEASFRVLHVGGTIRSCQNILISIDQATYKDLMGLVEAEDQNPNAIIQDDPQLEDDGVVSSHAASSVV
ncbi:MAG: Rpp14/Pop5 family protein [archaeon]|nr:Rpp14/Pop5 family protein [archaeon]